METTVNDFEEIEEFLKDLRFRKSALGVNEADVYACLKDVDSMYRDKLVQISNNFAKEREQLLKQVSAAPAAEITKELDEKLCRLNEENRMLKQQLEQVPTVGSLSETEEKLRIVENENNLLKNSLAAMPQNSDVATVQSKLEEANRTIASLQEQLNKPSSDEEPLLREKLIKADQISTDLSIKLAQETEKRKTAERLLEEKDQTGVSPEIEMLYKKKCELLTNALLETEQKRASMLDSAKQEVNKIIENAYAESYRLQAEQQRKLVQDKETAEAELKKMEALKVQMSKDIQQTYDSLQCIMQNLDTLKTNTNVPENDSENSKSSIDALSVLGDGMQK